MVLQAIFREEYHKRRSFKEEYFEMLEKKNVDFKRNTCLNSLVIFMIGIEYSGALHLSF
jgi:hypothetical protein